MCNPGKPTITAYIRAFIPSHYSSHEREPSAVAPKFDPHGGTRGGATLDQYNTFDASGFITPQNIKTGLMLYIHFSGYYNSAN